MQVKVKSDQVLDQVPQMALFSMIYGPWIDAADQMSYLSIDFEVPALNSVCVCVFGLDDQVFYQI